MGGRADCPPEGFDGGGSGETFAVFLFGFATLRSDSGTGTFSFAKIRKSQALKAMWRLPMMLMATEFWRKEREDEGWNEID